MKKLFFIMSLSYLHAYHPIELAQPFCEVGAILRENLIGPLSIKAQINSLIKGALLGSISQISEHRESYLQQKNIIENYIRPITYISNGIAIVDLIKNHKNQCFISKALGFCVMRVLITKCFK